MAWFKTRGEADRFAARLLDRGGVEANVVPAPPRFGGWFLVWQYPFPAPVQFR